MQQLRYLEFQVVLRAEGQRAGSLSPHRSDHRWMGMSENRAGDGRVKRVIYPPGFSWSRELKAIVGTELCQHAHVGFLAKGQIHIQYADGCTVDIAAPQAVAIEPGHDGWVVGDEPAVMIEFDFERDTVRRLGMPAEHSH